LRQPPPVGTTGPFLGFPVNRVGGRKIPEQRFDLRAYLGGIGARPVRRDSQYVAVELPNIFGELLEAGLAAVERAVQDGLVEVL
jgi:hypothetical protein